MTTVMVVDDAAFMRLMLKDILIAGGLTIVAEATNGIEAVQLFKQLRPDVVTMDITMPEMDGLEALREIRRYDPRASVIMCSAIGQQAMVIDSIQAGAKDFVVKPFQEHRVIEAIKRLTQ